MVDCVPIEWEEFVACCFPSAVVLQDEFVDLRDVDELSFLKVNEFLRGHC